jgi:hypothetical protein
VATTQRPIGGPKRPSSASFQPSTGPGHRTPRSPASTRAQPLPPAAHHRGLVAEQIDRRRQQMTSNPPAPGPAARYPAPRPRPDPGPAAAAGGRPRQPAARPGRRPPGQQPLRDLVEAPTWSSPTAARPNRPATICLGPFTSPRPYRWLTAHRSLVTVPPPARAHGSVRLGTASVGVESGGVVTVPS